MEQIEGFAEKSSKEFIESLNSLRALATQIYKKGIQFTTIETNKGSQFKDMIFVITGSLSKKDQSMRKL